MLPHSKWYSTELPLRVALIRTFMNTYTTFTQRVYRMAGNFWGRKLSRILQFCGHSWKFSLWNLVTWHLLVRHKRAIYESFLRKNYIFYQFAKVFFAKIIFFTNLRKFSLQKLYFLPICESFLPQKFSAIQYLTEVLHYYSTLSVVTQSQYAMEYVQFQPWTATSKYLKQRSFLPL